MQEGQPRGSAKAQAVREREAPPEPAPQENRGFIGDPRGSPGEVVLSERDELPRFFLIQQLAANENALYNLLDGLKAGATHASFFCREYWGSCASEAQLSLERMHCNDRLKKQIHQACIYESLALGLTSHFCSGSMDGVSAAVRSRLRNLVFYVHENCVILLDFVCQRWLAETEARGESYPWINLDLVFRLKKYRRLRLGDHITAMRQQNEMILNVLRHLSRPSTKRTPGRSTRGAPSTRDDLTPSVKHRDVIALVADVLASRTPIDRMRTSNIRSRVLQFMRFRPLLADQIGSAGPWPAQDSYERFGTERFGSDGPLLYFEPLPPMLARLSLAVDDFVLPPPGRDDLYTLVLDLDETLAHYVEHEPGVGYLAPRPGAQDFLQRMNGYGFELVIFTAATQDYADWVINQLDTEMRVHHRLYRQHSLPWGPVFIKDLSRLGRSMDRVLIIDNVQENYMLQPENGIFICPWYDDPKDTALFALTPLLEEIVTTRASVPQMLARYKDQIPSWAGFDNFDPAEYQLVLPEEDEQLNPLAGPVQQPRVGGPYQQPRPR
jgi:Dullard-like phosphatase family protein